MKDSICTAKHIQNKSHYINIYILKMNAKGIP